MLPCFQENYSKTEVIIIVMCATETKQTQRVLTQTAEMEEESQGKLPRESDGCELS